LSTFEFEPVVRETHLPASLPFVFTPHPVISVSDETLEAYIAGNDPDTGKPLIGEIIDILTKPINETKLKSYSAKTKSAATTQGLLKPDTEDNLQRLFYKKGWTDGLPIILPTEERVAKMLAGTNASPDEEVGEKTRFDIRGNVKYTVANVAVIAVMAGARPEHFPVILAVAASKTEAIQPSTTAFGSVLMVNGPIRKEIGINCGIGAFSPVTLANSVIGRAWTLMSTCWEDMRPKKNLWSSQGSNLTYNNMCCGENEESSVWEPFHVQKGFRAEESVVSVFQGWTLINSVGGAAIRSVGEEMCLEMGVIPPTYTNATVVMDPLVAKVLKEKDGFATKKDYSQWLSENIKMKAETYWGFDHVNWWVAPLAEQGMEPYASWKKAPADTLIAPFHKPEQINIVVVGGETSPVWHVSDYGYLGTASIDRWRPGKSGEACKDGTRGLPQDPIADYD
jgi:hypothetical protein